MITAKYFERATGRKPVDDDLERANCPKSGQLGHWACGWCNEKNLPHTMTPNKQIKQEINRYVET